ncbi:MAG: SDR family NAD(P)-dependent oxidoreductase [Planctomycetota bacterium]
MRDLAGKRALVTGAASGIGRAIALRLAAERVHLLLVDVDQVGLENVARLVRDHGVDVATCYCDVSDPAQVTEVTKLAYDQWAGVDVLVNNAGVTYHGFTHHMPDAEWQRLLAINLHAPLQFTQELLPGLLARPRAHVLNVCSVLGLVGLPRVSAYCTTKFAMVGYSQSLRSEYGRWGLGVTALCPGLVKTSLFSSARPETAGAAPKQPPSWVCTTPERVAKAAVSAIRRNRAKVMVEPFARVVYGFQQAFPTVFDWALRLGEHRRVRKQELELASLSTDRTDAYRQLIAAEMQRKQAKRGAA